MSFAAGVRTWPKAAQPLWFLSGLDKQCFWFDWCIGCEIYMRLCQIPFCPGSQKVRGIIPKSSIMKSWMALSCHDCNCKPAPSHLEQVEVYRHDLMTSTHPRPPLPCLRTLAHTSTGTINKMPNGSEWLCLCQLHRFTSKNCCHCHRKQLFASSEQLQGHHQAQKCGSPDTKAGCGWSRGMHR